MSYLRSHFIRKLNEIAIDQGVLRVTLNRCVSAGRFCEHIYLGFIIFLLQLSQSQELRREPGKMSPNSITFMSTPKVNYYAVPTTL